MEKYYLIKTDDRGLSQVSVMDRKSIEKFLKDITNDEEATDILERFLIPKKELNLAYKSDSYILIRGEAIKPTVAEKIIKLQI